MRCFLVSVAKCLLRKHQEVWLVDDRLTLCTCVQAAKASPKRKGSAGKQAPAHAAANGPATTHAAAGVAMPAPGKGSASKRAAADAAANGPATTAGLILQTAGKGTASKRAAAGASPPSSPQLTPNKRQKTALAPPPAPSIKSPTAKAQQYAAMSHISETRLAIWLFALAALVSALRTGAYYCTHQSRESAR
jgi:hypothetical protein